MTINVTPHSKVPASCRVIGPAGKIIHVCCDCVNHSAHRSGVVPLPPVVPVDGGCECDHPSHKEE